MKCPESCKGCSFWTDQGCIKPEDDTDLIFCISNLCQECDSLSAEVKRLKKETKSLRKNTEERQMVLCELINKNGESDSKIKILQDRLHECDELFEPFAFADKRILFNKAAAFMDSTDAELRIIGGTINNIIIYLENRHAGKTQVTSEA